MARSNLNSGLPKAMASTFLNHRTETVEAENSNLGKVMTEAIRK